MSEAKKKPNTAVQTTEKPAPKKLTPIVKPMQPAPGTGGNGDV
jgi:hypothetical protein